MSQYKASWNCYTAMEKELWKTSTTKNLKTFRFCNIITFNRKVKEVNPWHIQWICASYYIITNGLQRPAKCFWLHSLRSLNLQMVYTVWPSKFKYTKSFFLFIRKTLNNSRFRWANLICCTLQTIFCLCIFKKVVAMPHLLISLPT